ncbi:MAG: hypothetical protein SPJ90_06775 [Prevotella sp.]|nr:hypothetical protein [Prevotellaceae bacterium]MDY5844111.1 hypothetical protein [Prevotella sp.]
MNDKVKSAHSSWDALGYKLLGLQPVSYSYNFPTAWDVYFTHFVIMNS